MSGNLGKIRDDEALIVGISELLNAMTELKRLAELYNLERILYGPREWLRQGSGVDGEPCITGS